MAHFHRTLEELLSETETVLPLLPLLLLLLRRVLLLMFRNPARKTSSVCLSACVVVDTTTFCEVGPVRRKNAVTCFLLTSLLMKPTQTRTTSSLFSEMYIEAFVLRV